ncbi:hypothetical protein M0R04_06685 [Candidatus Dojkabacteria bacterium]|jgi:hypothetical protein|nr:hypothetical protein [Candidatus Dojkabacteria bacterium]
MTSYKELNEQGRDELLLELANTPMYQAILHYLHEQDGLVINGLRAADPFKNPTDLARHQGFSMGLFSLRLKVEDLIKQAKDSEQVSERKE